MNVPAVHGTSRFSVGTSTAPDRIRVAALGMALVAGLCLLTSPPGGPGHASFPPAVAPGAAAGAGDQLVVTREGDDVVVRDGAGTLCSRRAAADPGRLDIAGAASVTLTGDLALPCGEVVVHAARVVCTGDVAARSVDLDATEYLAVDGSVVAGLVHLEGRRVVLGEGALIDASGEAGGGCIAIGGADQGTELVVIGGRAQVRAEARAGGRGGRIAITAAKLIQGGRLSVDGLRGGGGDIILALGEQGTQTDAGALSARGATRGGGIVAGGPTGSAAGTERRAPSWFLSGTLDASAGAGAGGSVTVLGAALDLVATRVDASGDAGGGAVAIGGSAHGGGAAADTVAISAAARITCDARQRGDGGRVTVWSQARTQARGAISARGGALAGDGGAIELSSAGAVSATGAAEAGAARGAPGRLLLDPKNIVISDAVTAAPQFELVDPHPGAGNLFGANVRALPSGNVVVTAQDDSFGGLNAGAVYLFNGHSGALLAALVGGTAGDGVGGSLTVLTNGNYVVTSPGWDAGAVADAGAVTWCDGRVGLTGVVGAANSLVGGTAGDFAGSKGVLGLPNGNYLVASPNWTSGTSTAAGAVTWGNGLGGTVGPISAANSLVGSTPGDQIGSSGNGDPALFILAGGDYVVRSLFWQTAGAFACGAVTWGDGKVGTAGVVGPANSLVGSTTRDLVGGGGLDVLSNGNYVVTTPHWTLPGVGVVGAVTWASGRGGTVGAVGVGNSLVGSHDGDTVGSGTVTRLANGNFVVRSDHWGDGTTVTVGATTWCTGSAPTVAAVSAANSLVGSSFADALGQPLQTVVALRNGDYVVCNVNWHNAQHVQVGAVTWGDGRAGVAGVISPANSLVGTPDGGPVGGVGVVPLANGLAVICDYVWNNGAATQAGAVTLIRPGLAGTISAANSLVGTSTNDLVGYPNAVALANGNYVVDSLNWHNADGIPVGAVTWCDGANGRTGAITPGNSLVGTSPNGGGVGGIGLDNSPGVLALSNGNYVVTSYNWSDGVQTFLGAVTWGDGRGGLVGTVSAANSLIGATAGDRVGFGGVSGLPNGNYVVRSYQHWHDATGAEVGAVTWGDGAHGTSGIVGPANSLVGTTDGDQVGSGGITVLASGDFAVRSPAWDDGATVDAGAVTWVDGTNGRSLTGFGPIGRGNSVVGGAPGSNVQSPQDDVVDGQLLVGFPSDGGGRVRALVTSPAAIAAYASAPAGTITVPTAFLTRVLDAGTAVTLQASNDLTVASPVLASAASGTAGALTLQAGRSLLLGASIATGGATLTLIANDDAANGVVDAQRDPGAATITMAAGATITAGGGAVAVALRPGVGKTNQTSGQVVLGGISARTLSVLNAGSTPGSGITQTGTWTIHGGGALSAGPNPIDLQGTIDLGTGTLASGPGTTRLAGTLAIALDATGAGLLDLGSAAALLAQPTLSFTSSATVPVGTHLTLVRHADAAASGGTFAGLAEGAPVSGGGQTFRLTYAGGPQGRDIALDYAGLPAAVDIGTARPALGGVSGDSTAFSIAAGGTGIGGSADDFRFVPWSLPGDGEISARVALTSTQAGAKAGLMLRDGSAAGARNVLLALNRQSGLVLQWRSQADGATQTQVQAAGLTGPVWLRLVRHGDTVSASYSQDAVTWTAAGQAVVQLSRPAAAGAAVSGASTTITSTGTFTGLTTTPYAPGQPLNLLTAFGAAMVGSGAETNAGLTTVAGAGTLIGDTASDGGEFLASAPLAGDFDVRAQVLYQRATDGNAQAGLMLRAGTAADAPNLFLFLTPSHGGKVQRRSVAGGPTALLARTNNTAHWYRITRSGDQVATFWSLDGAAWQPLATAAMPGPLDVGLAVCGANPALLGVATFANVGLTSPDPAPQVTVTAPAAVSDGTVIPFTLSFSTPVTGLTAAAIVVGNGAAGALTGSGTAYTLLVTPVADGPVTVTVPANAAVSSVGLGNLAGTGAITSDRTAPVATISPDGTTTSTSPIAFTIAFSEPVSGLSSASFGHPTNGSIVSLTDSGAHDRYTLLVAAGGNGAVGVGLSAGAVHDAAGNANAQASASVTYSAPTAPPLPAAVDIGTARPALGGVSGDSTAFSIAAGGTGIGGSADDFRFVPWSLPGDGEISARVALTSTQAGAKAGLMLRDGSAAGARNVLLALNRQSGLVLQWRSQADGATQTQVQAAGLTGPVWLRLVRHGDTVSASYSQDAVTWTAAGQAVVQLSRPAAAGAAVSGASTTITSTGTFTGLTTTPYAPGQPLNLLTAFGAAMVGSGAETNAGLTTVAGAGTLIGDTASDGGEFLASAPLAGDFDVRAQVLYQRATDGNAQAGLMLRAGTAADAPNLFLFLTPSHGGKVQRRSVAGGPTALLARTNNTAHWYRITRSGDQVATFWSLDGAAWQPLATAAMPGPLNVGLAVCGANPALLGVATYANVGLTSPDLAPPLPQGVN